MMKWTLPTVLAGLILGIAGTSQASLIGDTVSASQENAIAGADFDQSTAVVGNGGPEFTFSFQQNILFNIDIGADFIEIQHAESSGRSLLDIMLFSDLDWVDGPGRIVGVDFSITGAGISNFDASDVTFTDDSVTVNFNGSFINAGTVIRVDLETEHTVPEPAAVGLIGLGLVGLGWMRRRRQDV